MSFWALLILAILIAAAVMALPAVQDIVRVRMARKREEREKALAHVEFVRASLKEAAERRNDCRIQPITNREVRS